MSETIQTDVIKTMKAHYFDRKGVCEVTCFIQDI